MGSQAARVCSLLATVLFWVPIAGVAEDRAVESASPSASTVGGGGDQEAEEAGAVAPSALDFPDSKVRHSVGFGARVSLERAAPFRVDVGFSDEGANVTARFGLPF